MAGVWASLQFKWIQLQYPVVSMAFEKLLVAAAVPVGAMVLSWGCLAAVGPSQAPFYQAALLAGGWPPHRIAFSRLAVLSLDLDLWRVMQSEQGCMALWRCR